MNNDEQKKASEELNEKEELLQQEQEQLEGGVNETKEVITGNEPSGLCNTTCVTCSPGSAI